MTNVWLAAAGGSCLAAALVAYLVMGDSRNLLVPISIMITLTAGTGLLVLAALRAAMGSLKLTGVAATLAAAAIMVAQYWLVRLMDPSGLPGLVSLVSLVIAWVGGLTFLLAGVYWLKAIMVAQKPPIER